VTTSWVSMPHQFRGVHYFGGGSICGCRRMSGVVGRGMVVSLKSIVKDLE